VEKLVSREEAPVDVNSGPARRRVGFPPLNQNSSPPAGLQAFLPPARALATAANGTMPNNEPRKIRALTVKGDAAENGGIPAGAGRTCKTGPRCPIGIRANCSAQRNPSAGQCRPPTHRPTLSPQSAPASDPSPPTRLATNAVQTAPSAGGGYLVQVSSQKNEADAKASYRGLQNKFRPRWGPVRRSSSAPISATRGSITATMVGPFGSTEEAAQFCGQFESAGGQCVVQKN